MVSGGIVDGYGTADRVACLHKASDKGYRAIVILLLAAGANVDKQANNGKTPLILAAQYGYIEVVKELLKAGANKKL